MNQMSAIRSGAGALFLVLAASTASADVQLSIQDGRVTLTATNATVRQILTEWARVGQTKIVNVERIPGGPLTLQLTNMPEQEALDMLLRSVTGYMAAPRSTPVANLSHYDRILVLPKAAVARTPVVAPPTRQPVFQPPPDNDDDQPSVGQPPRGPLFPTFQQPPPNEQEPAITGFPGFPGGFPPQPAQAPYGTPVDQQTGQPLFVAPAPGGAQAPVGTPRPGMIIQPPVQPGTMPVIPGIVLPGQFPPPPDDQ
jgi:hypothetical protein